MTGDELRDLVEQIRQRRCERTGVEVKAARGGTPKRLYEALSAFANSPDGGILLFGLDENQGFEIVGVGDAHRLQEEVSHLASADMEPVLRPDFAVEDLDGKIVVAAEIAEVPADQKPCYYRPAGLQKGAYIRVGNTNRQMTDYEIFGYTSNRKQPDFDAQPVEDATLDDLDRNRLESYLSELRRSRPGATYLNGPFEQTLMRLRVVRDVEGVLRPTLAGLLVFGDYPQQFVPQLCITFLQYYGTTETEKGPRGERFLDNRKFEGSIPVMLADARDHVMAMIRKSSLITGLLRQEIPEYPEEAIREAIANAVVHRDYSHFVRGSYIQIRLFADRLEIQSPGGLYGSVTEETLEDEQSTRNQALMRFMEDLHLVENRGTGIRSMIEAVRRANLEPPVFEDKRSSFWVTLKNHTLLNPETLAWLSQFAAVPLVDSQRLALAYLRYNNELTNRVYQRLNRVDSLTATRELRGLVQSRLLEQHGTRRWTHYTLTVSREVTSGQGEALEEQQVLDYVRKHGSIANRECRGLLGVTSSRASDILKRMRDRGILRQVGERRWARYVLP